MDVSGGAIAVNVMNGKLNYMNYLIILKRYSTVILLQIADVLSSRFHMMDAIY
ncbi:hypothetical protein GCM10023142_08110 [Anaerocolumna aminovalerica]